MDTGKKLWSVRVQYEDGFENKLSDCFWVVAAHALAAARTGLACSIDLGRRSPEVVVVKWRGTLDEPARPVPTVVAKWSRRKRAPGASRSTEGER